MTLCLYECMRAIGLQRHYARFTSMGVYRAAHLPALTIEDYHILGIHTMEDRNLLFQLVQLVKTLDLKSLGFEDGDDDYDADDGGEDCTVADTSFIHVYKDKQHIYDDEEEKGAVLSKVNASTFSKPSCVCRRLDFSCESIDHYQKPFSSQNDEPVHGKGSITPVQLELHTASAALCGNKGRYNHHVPSHCPTGGGFKPDITGGISMYNSQTRLSPQSVSFHKPNSRPAPVESKRFSNKTIGSKEGKRISRKEKLYTEIDLDWNPELMGKPPPVYEWKRTAGYNYGLPLSPHSVSNKKQAMKPRICVCVRKRPLTYTESRRGEVDVVSTLDGECVIVHEGKEAVDLTQYILQHRFYFDQVFGEENTNEELYHKTASPLVQHMLNGGKATCFAYGQTGAGKTHTMLGSSAGGPGLYALAAREIFAHLSSTRMPSQMVVYVSFFEIYCGQLYDLLNHRKRLFAREDGQKVVHIAGLRDIRVESVHSLMEVITKGTEERTQGVSGVNPLSSRSHALLQIQLRHPNQQISGRMWFVDLAGSERASDTKEPDRQSRMESAEINQSLLALKECIRSLDQAQSHTPFRQSKLTQVLKDSFVGDSVTCMIANISPGHLATEHTLNTLRYADRVKELRVKGGLRGGRKCKTIPSPKSNLSNSNSSSGGSSIGNKGKTKIGKQEAFGSTSSTPKMLFGGAVLCSSPKSSRFEEENCARARKGFGLEEITPVRGSLVKADTRQKREGVGKREDRRQANEERYGRPDYHSDSDQITRAGQPTAEQLYSWVSPKEGGTQEGNLSLTQRESGLYHTQKPNQKRTPKQGPEEERRWRQQRRQVESTKAAHVEVKRTGDRDFQKVEGRDKERERHLRQYHQQLQQFALLSASSSDHLFSSSTCLSFSSSNQSAISSFVSPNSSLRHSSHLSAQMYPDLEEVLNVYKAGIEVSADGNGGQTPFPCGEISLEIETSPCCNTKSYENGYGDSSYGGKDLTVSWEETVDRFGQDTGESEKRRTEEEVVRVLADYRSPRGLERKPIAWETTRQTQQADRVQGAGALWKDVGEFVSYNRDSEGRAEVGQDGMDGVCCPEQGDGYGLVSNHNINQNNSLFCSPPAESPHQQVPGERPLSPVSGQTNVFQTPNKFCDLSVESKHIRCAFNNLPILLQNGQLLVPSSSCREKERCSATYIKRRDFLGAQMTTLPLATSITQNGCKIPAEPLKKLPENWTDTQVHKHPEVKAKISVLPQEETPTDSLSYIMEPLRISLLEVEPQAATASFILGEQNHTSPCLPDDDRQDVNGEEDKVCLIGLKYKDVELQQAKTHRPLTSNNMAGTNLTVPKKDRCWAACEQGIMEAPLPRLKLVSGQDQDQTQLAHDTSPYASMPTTPHSLQHAVNAGPSSSHDPLTNGAIQIPPEYAHNLPCQSADSSLLPESKSILGHLSSVPNQSPSVYPYASSNSDLSLHINGRAELNGQEYTSNQGITSKIYPSTLSQLDQSQWRVVQAHWEQLEEMEALCRIEGKLLCQQPDMPFREYVHKLEEILERKTQYVHRVRTELQPYLKTGPSSDHQHKQGEDDHN